MENFFTPTLIATSKNHPLKQFSRLLNFVSFRRMDSALLGHFRLSQETDNQTKVFAVVCKKKDEVRISLERLGGGGDKHI